jgi:putative phosphoesterase
MTMSPPAASLRVVVMADTHLRDPPPTRVTGTPRPATRDLPAAVWQRLEGCNAILHAGDVLEIGLLQRLAKVAPTYAVLGNNDLTLTARLPVARVVELGGIRIGMIHDSGPSAGRTGRMRRRFPDAAVVVFGHSHAPCDEVGIDGQRLFNPGSPTQRRAQPTHTLGELVIAGGVLTEHHIIDLGR